MNEFKLDKIDLELDTAKENVQHFRSGKYNFTQFQIALKDNIETIMAEVRELIFENARKT